MNPKKTDAEKRKSAGISLSPLLNDELLAQSKARGISKSAYTEQLLREAMGMSGKKVHAPATIYMDSTVARVRLNESSPKSVRGKTVRAKKHR